MSESIINNLIQAFTAIAVGIIGVLAWDGRRKTLRIRDQVENDHDTNFRDEQDERHAENHKTLNSILSMVIQLRTELEQTNTRVDSLWRKYVNPHR